MSQIPILNGIVTDANAEFRTNYPINLCPVLKETAISNGYLRPADGIVTVQDDCPGIDRGGVIWQGVHYRVLGNALCSVADDFTITEFGTISGSEPVRFAHSPEKLAIVADLSAWYFDGTDVISVTDPDLGPVIDVIFVDGYFMFTDGEFLIVTELADPQQIDPLKYGTAESRDDRIQALHVISNEPYAIGEITAEVFENVGGDVFPFQRIEGAQIERGSVGKYASCVFDTNLIALVGSGVNESPSVYLCANATSNRIATREIDKLLKAYTSAELSAVRLETRVDEGHKHLYIHLPDRTLVYDAAASAAAEEPVWFVLTSAIEGFEAYRARNLTWFDNRWICGEFGGQRLGELTQERSDHFGDAVRWEFGTVCVYNDGLSAIVHEMELVALTGRTADGVEPRISTSYSKDGLTWSQDKSIQSGTRGQRRKRLVWRNQGTIGHFRIQRFTGDSDSFMSFARLEAQLEPLAVAVP